MNSTKILAALNNALAAIDAAKPAGGMLEIIPNAGGLTITGTRTTRAPIYKLGAPEQAAVAALLGLASQADSTTMQDAHEINRLRSALAQATEEAAQFRAESIRFAAQAKDQSARAQQAEGRALAMTPPSNAVEMERLRSELAQSDARAQARMQELFAAKEEAAAARADAQSDVQLIKDLRAETRAAGKAEADALAEAEAMAEAMAQGEPSQVIIKRAEKAEAQLAESVAEARALGRSLDKIRAERSQMDDVETAKTIAQLRAQVAALTQANVAPQLNNAADVSISFDPGQQTRALARAGVSLETLKAAFVWHFADRRDPSKGGKWISRPLMVSEAQRLAVLIFPEHSNNE